MRTVWSTVNSVGSISCSTSKIYKFLVMFSNSFLAKAVKRQVLPIPFLPISPYLRPSDSLMVVSSNRVFPATIRVRLSQAKSLMAAQSLSWRTSVGGTTHCFFSMFTKCFWMVSFLMFSIFYLFFSSFCLSFFICFSIFIFL